MSKDLDATTLFELLSDMPATRGNTESIRVQYFEGVAIDEEYFNSQINLLNPPNFLFFLKAFNAEHGTFRSLLFDYTVWLLLIDAPAPLEANDAGNHGKEGEPAKKKRRTVLTTPVQHLANLAAKLPHREWKFLEKKASLVVDLREDPHKIDVRVGISY